MTHEKFIGVTFNDLDRYRTQISRLSEFSFVNSAEIVLNIPHRAHVLPERDYMTFRFLLLQICLSVVSLAIACLSLTFVRPTQGLKLSAIFLHRCTLAIHWPPCKVLRKSSQGNPSIGGVTRKRGSKIQRFWTYRRLYLTNGTRYGLGYNYPDFKVIGVFRRQ